MLTKKKSKTSCNTKITEIESKIPSDNNSVTTAALNVNTTEIEDEIPGITNLDCKAFIILKAGDKIPDTAGFITIPEFNRLSKINFDARKKESTRSFASESQIDTTLDVADQKRKKKIKNFKRLMQVIFWLRVTLMMVVTDQKNIQSFKRFLTFLQQLLVWIKF